MPNLGEVRDTRAQNFNNEVETKESVNLIHVFHLYIYIYICVCVCARAYSDGFRIFFYDSC